MKVVKKDGRLQEFDINKIKTSIMRASDDLNEPLNTSDIDNIAHSIEDKIKKYNRYSMEALEIHQIVVEELKNNGFQHIAKAYDEGTK
ncbi:ATP cone domain-containing protein [Clostridium ganghwense]|uniref:ATP cone domain-containing protein n=1 Tax=Clostridium ganghwense TaxID=312089 RepID=A0ABT4CRS9_9CLOT|nr:ATP cone domain-containing protein [Clostridium ganghwense]MCY6371770.1 ATP cone domain-containing protein [Clostridium ganghwense]